MNELLQRAISGLFVAVWFFSTILLFPNLFIISIIISLLIILFIEWPKLAKQYKFFFPLYPALSFFFILYLQISGYKILNLVTFSACFLFDSSSYVFGKLFGTHKIAPSISPGKTIEGFLGGCLTLILSYLMYLTFGTGVTKPYEVFKLTNFLIPIIISFLAFSGDLFESYLKRKSGLKDFGNIVPGHGGLLDRFDSILFVVIFVFFLRDYLVTIFYS